MTKLILCFLTSQLTAEFKFCGNEGSINLDSPSTSFILNESIPAFNGKIKCASSLSDNIKSVNGNETINFVDNAQIEISGNNFEVQGVYDPKITAASNDSILLSDGNVLNLTSGKIVHQNIIVGTNSLAKIFGIPTFNGQVTLTDATSILELGLSDRLSNDIILNNGKIKLANDLLLKKNFVGNGAIELNNNVLEISGNCNSNINVENSGSIKLFGFTSLSGTWNFAQAYGTTLIQGNGNTLNLNGGTLQVAEGHSVIFTDLRLQGLGSGGSLNLFDSATNPGTIIFRNTTIELSGNYILNAGVLRFDGGISKILGPVTATLKANGLNTKFIIDKVVVYFESLSGSPTNPFAFSAGGTIEQLNGGKIRAMAPNKFFADFTIDANANHGQIVPIHQSRNLHINARIVAENIAAPTIKSFYLDGNYNNLKFPTDNSKVIVLGNNIKVTLINMTLKNFSLENIQFGTGSQLLIGDNVTVDISKNITFPNSGKKFEVVGNATLRGFKKNLTLEDSLAIDISEPNKQLAIENLIIKSKHLHSLGCTASQANITLKNCELIIDDQGLEFNNGNLSFDGENLIKGTNPSSIAGQTFFKFSSTGLFTVKSCSTIKLEDGIELIYSANPMLDGNNTYATKRHFIMTDASSTLSLDSATLTSTATGLALDKGNLLVDGKSILNASTNPAEEAELGSALHVYLANDANFIFNGNIKHVISTL